MKDRLEEPFYSKYDNNWTIVGYGDEGMYMLTFGTQREAWKYYFENHCDTPHICPCCGKPL